MGTILNGGLIGLVILLGFLKYLYTGSIDNNLIFVLAMKVLPILTGVTMGYNLFVESARGTEESESAISAIFKLFAVGVCIMISIGAGFLYIWTFEDAITKGNGKSYSIVEDVILEVDEDNSVRSDKSDVSMYIKYDGKKKKIASFMTRENLNLKIKKEKTVDGYDFYNIKYTQCYDFKDNRHGENIFPVIIDADNKLVGFNDHNQFTSWEDWKYKD